MGPRILRIVAFFYLAITTSQATLLLHPVGGVIAAAVAGKVMFKGALMGAAGLAAAGAIHKHLEEYWKQHLGANTRMPKSIKDCMNNGNGNEQGGVDANSLIRFQSFVPSKDINININMTKSFNLNTSGGGNIDTSDKTNMGGNGGTGGSGSQGSSSSSQESNQASGKGSSSDQTASSTKGFYGPPRSSATDMAKSYGPSRGSTQSSQSENNNADIASIQNSVASLFFAEGDLRLGKKMNIHFTKTTNMAPFLPREMVDKLPFTLSKFPDILTTFNLSANSQEATIMKETLKYCEDDKPGDKCCTSMETMIDFSTSIIGKSVKAMSANIDKDCKMEYKVQGIKKLPCGQQAVTCHKVPFPCAVFYCQKLDKMSVFIGTLVGTDGSTINAPLICHEDTTSWDHGHWVFQSLNAKPGSFPVCHFLLDDDVLWIAN